MTSTTSESPRAPVASDRVCELAGSATCLYPYPWVERGVDEIRQEAGQQHENSDEQRHARDRVHIVFRDGFDEQLTHSVPAEYALGERGADEQQRELVREEGRHRNQRRAQAVLHERLRPRESFGLRG